MSTKVAPGPGDPAPDFVLPDGDGKQHALGDYAGRRLVLYFYPRDNTPGCTTEACDFSDAHAALARRGVAVLGVSPDSVASHARFRDQHGLNFPLLADPEKGVLRRYGAWGEKSLYGKKTVGVIRSTFLIGEDGRVIRAWTSVKAKGHVGKVIEAIDSLPAPVTKSRK